MLPPPDPSSTLALPPAQISNCALRVARPRRRHRKSCVQQQKQLADTAPARRRAKLLPHTSPHSKPRDAATRDDMATLRLAERERLRRGGERRPRRAIATRWPTSCGARQGACQSAGEGGDAA